MQRHWTSTPSGQPYGLLRLRHAEQERFEYIAFQPDASLVHLDRLPHQEQKNRSVFIVGAYTRSDEKTEFLEPCGAVMF